MILFQAFPFFYVPKTSSVSFSLRQIYLLHSRTCVGMSNMDPTSFVPRQARQQSKRLDWPPHTLHNSPAILWLQYEARSCTKGATVQHQPAWQAAMGMKALCHIATAKTVNPTVGWNDSASEDEKAYNVNLWTVQLRIWGCLLNIASFATSKSVLGTFVISPIRVTLAQRGSCTQILSAWDIQMTSSCCPKLWISALEWKWATLHILVKTCLPQDQSAHNLQLFETHKCLQSPLDSPAMYLSSVSPIETQRPFSSAAPSIG